MNTTFNIQLCSVTSKIAKKQNGNNFRDFRSHREKKCFQSSVLLKQKFLGIKAPSVSSDMIGPLDRLGEITDTEAAARFVDRRTDFRGTQSQFSENICSEDDLRSRIFRTFFVKFLACLPLLGFSNI